jgi:hypothetical protein
MFGGIAPGLLRRAIPIPEPGIDANAEQNGEHRSTVEGESAPTEHKAILHPQNDY